MATTCWSSSSGAPPTPNSLSTCGPRPSPKHWSQRLGIAAAPSEAETAGWLFGIAKNQLRHYYRRGKAQRRAMERLGLERPPLGPHTEAEILERAGLAEVRAELVRAVAALSPELSEAVRLRIVHELPYPDVAQRLGISEQAARARVSRALRQLSTALDPADLKEALQA